MLNHRDEDKTMQSWFNAICLYLWDKNVKGTVAKTKKNESKAWHHATDASTTSIGVDTKKLLSEYNMNNQ